MSLENPYQFKNKGCEVRKSGDEKGRQYVIEELF
jgi:hypothetical protein